MTCKAITETLHDQPVRGEAANKTGRDLHAVLWALGHERFSIEGNVE